MKAVRITTDSCIDYVDLKEPIHKSAGEIVGGLVEHVRPRYLQKPYCMLCNESGLIDQLPLNPIASLLYGFQDHGQPIAGNVLIIKEEGCEWCGMDDPELIKVIITMINIREELEEFIKESHHGEEG